MQEGKELLHIGRKGRGMLRLRDLARTGSEISFWTMIEPLPKYHGKYGNEGKYCGISKSRRKGKYTGGKDRSRDVKGSTLEEGAVAGMPNRILAGEVLKNGKYRELEEMEVRKCGTRRKQNKNRWRGNRKESKIS